MGALQGLLLRSDQTDSVISELVQKLMYGMSTWEPDEVSWNGTVTFFIQTFFIRNKVYTNFLYTGQCLYGTKFIQDKFYTGTKFI